jgi:hypothetical protein
VAIAAGFAAHYYFADAASGPPAIAVALLHGGAHALAIALCTIAMSGVAQDLALPDFWLIVLTGIVGGLVCSTIFGAYLLVSLNGLGRHWNEAFSSLRIADWKCFLRLRISEDGSITVYPIGLRRVPEAACDDTKAPPLRTELIEPPIEIPRRAPA